MRRFVVFGVVIFTLALCVSAEVVPFQDCSNDESVNCEITELRVSPCKEVNKDKNKPCKFKKGTNAHLEVDFTPNFVSNNLTAQMYWTHLVDVPFVGMDTDACKTSTCPTVSGEKNKYTFDLLISKGIPVGQFRVKLIVADRAKPEVNKCCLIYKIHITKSG